MALTKITRTILDTGISDSSDATAITINSSEQVGIGTTSPVATLQVKTQTNGNLAFQNSTSVSGGVKLNCFNDAANASSPFEIDGSTLQFNIGSTEKMRIASDGDVFIGTTSGLGKFNMDFSSVFGKVLKYTGSTATIFPIVFDYGSSTAGSISITSSATSYNTSSDYRLKENVTYEFDALDRIKKLKPARFNFIADADTTVDGFIAHEVSDIVPEAITGEKDGEQMQGIDQSKLVPLLTKAIQEQQAIIEDLKTRIEVLEA